MAQTASPLQILLIDDDPTDRHVVRRLLERADPPIDLAEADDAFAALDLLKTAVFDCLLVDQRMPGIIGTEFIRLLRSMETETRTPILLLSTETTHFLTADDARGAGGDLLIDKHDLTAERLEAAILSLVAERRGGKPDRAEEAS